MKTSSYNRQSKAKGESKNFMNINFSIHNTRTEYKKETNYNKKRSNHEFQNPKLSRHFSIEPNDVSSLPTSK
jgi:hypothetical protein